MTDDCSTDSSWEILQRSVADKRVRIFRNELNRHVCYTLNHSLAQARGKYVCVISVDDGFVAGKLRHDVDFLNTHNTIDVLYNDKVLIDDDDLPTGQITKHFANFSQDRMLKTLFFERNALPTPGMVVRRDALKKVGFYNPLFRLTQDYDLNIRLLLACQVAVSEQPFSYYRRRANGGNLSCASVETSRAIQAETILLLKENCKRITHLEQFRSIFPDFTRFSHLHDKDIPFYLGLILIESEDVGVRLAGLNVLYDFVIEHIDYLEKEYGFYAKDFMLITQKLGSISFDAEWMRLLIDKTKLTTLFSRILYRLWKHCDKFLTKKGVLTR